MKAFLEKWSTANSLAVSTGGSVVAVEEAQEPEPEPVHYALQGKAVLSEMSIEPCEVGCDRSVRFYNHEGVKYGLCEKCEVYQRIVRL